MIVLDNRLLINQGKTRACYLHPGDKDLVIKVPVGSKKADNRSNITELRGYQALMREQVDLFCISHCYGFVTTSLGKGLVCDCIRDDGGAVSRTIWDIIIYQDDCDVDHIKAVADAFCRFLIQRDTRLFDLNLKNIVLKLRNDGVYAPFAVDLKGRFDNKETIPVSSYSRYFARKKMDRRRRQLVERIFLFREKRVEWQ
ncbi:MAG: PhoP regulatory network YrbL family protein [Desulfobacteraceae bacterium]|nr:PhoP regulatory network YrbL family protein [Desulfobacteraceae bacterium]